MSQTSLYSTACLIPYNLPTTVQLIRLKGLKIWNADLVIGYADDLGTSFKTVLPVSTLVKKQITSKHSNPKYFFLGQTIHSLETKSIIGLLA
jgi:hypothetical protein